MTANGRHRADPLDLSWLDDAIILAGHWQQAAIELRDKLTENAEDPPLFPSVDLSARLAPYTAATEDVPRNVVCAVLGALAMCDLSVVKNILSRLRSMLTLLNSPSSLDPTEWVLPDYQAEINALETDLCDLLRAEGVWPQQPARTPEHLYHGRAAE